MAKRNSSKRTFSRDAVIAVRVPAQLKNRLVAEAGNNLKDLSDIVRESLWDRVRRQDKAAGIGGLA